MIEVPKHDSMTPIQTPSQSSQPTLSAPSISDKRPIQGRQRSSSAPIRQSPFESPVDEAFTTPRERPDPLERDFDRADVERELSRLTDDSANVPLPTGDSTAVSTMYDGTIGKGIGLGPEHISHHPIRGLSTYTESSLDNDEYDHDLAPRVLNFNGSSVYGETAGDGPINGLLPESRDGTVSSSDSFQGGLMDPVTQPKTSNQSIEEKENDFEGGVIPKRAGSLENQTGRSSHVGNLANLAMLQGHQLRTYDESGKAVKRDIPVLYEAPSNKHVIYNPDANVRSSNGVPDEIGVATPTKAESQNVELEPKALPKDGSAPTLTPLNELLEVAHETPDNASSSVPSHGTPKSDTSVPARRSQGSDSVRSDTLSAMNTNTSQPSTTTSKDADLRAQPQSVNTGTERAAVQRVSSATIPLANGRTSTSSNREGRPMTGSSTTSQMSSKIKGMIGRESGVPRRNSSDGSSSLVSSIRKHPRPADKEQDFEDLMKSDETVKYTLTPQNMREMEVCHVDARIDDSVTDCIIEPRISATPSPCAFRDSRIAHRVAEWHQRAAR